MYANIPQHLIQEIKDSVSIVQVIGRYMELKRAGRNHTGLCPFHGENAPSFNVSEERGFFHCFGCTAHGDVIRFIQMIENLSFVEAVKQLAGEAGIELPEVREMSSEERRRMSDQDRMYEATRLALEFFQKQLISHPKGKIAREYLEGRGVFKDMIDAFQLGYAPDSWEDLTNWLNTRGVSPRIAEKAGLVAPGKRGSHYDRFRDRVMFPIVMQNNRVVGFGGRVLSGEDSAKYINSPESPIFTKSKSLYGYHLARLAIGRKDRALIVEGNLDVVRMHQFGFDETVATLGTAVSEHHLRLLKRMTRNLVIVYDGDSAGKKAMFRSLDLFLKESLNARAVVLPAGQDPDDFLGEHGAEAMQKLIDDARYLFDIWLEDQYATRGSGPREISESLHRIVPMLAKMETVERTLYVQRVSERLGMGQDVVMQLLRQHAAKGNWDKHIAETAVRQHTASAADQGEAAEEVLLGLLLRYPEQVAGRFHEENVFALMRTAAIVVAARAVMNVLESGEVPEPSAIIDIVEDKEWKNRLAKLIINSEELNEDEVKDSFNDCVRAMKIRAVEGEIHKLNQMIQSSDAGDERKKLELSARKIELYQELQRMKSPATPNDL